METLPMTLQDIISRTSEDKMTYQPKFFRLSNIADREAFEQLLETPGLRVSTELHGQLRELIKSRNPSYKYPAVELDQAAIDFLGDTPSEEYGVWVYYSWLNKVVQILDETEYVEVRTNRNIFKITPEERDQIAQKRIGVLGLSVGQAVAISLSMERSYGELRIADFDELELSNLNRIRSGVQDLGLLKTVSTARQIAEIDPYLNVKCFHEGLTEYNLDEFFTDGGKLDIVIDECDGLDIKILARLKARELGVPVVMETSDRGMIDIERYDLEPERSIMHGLIDHLDQDPSKLKGLSNEEKIPYILPMLGLDTMSDRLKASMLEVEQTITTWPQLASDVILGGAISANVCRRISLDQFKASGRFFVDMNDIVSPEKAHVFACEAAEDITYADEAIDLDALKQEPVEGQLDINDDQINTLVDAAVWAPSGGNSQPWKFVYENKIMYLLLDKARASSFLDFASAGSYLSLGAATENLVLKAHEIDLDVKVDRFPDRSDAKLAAIFRFFPKGSGATAVEGYHFDDLAPAIKERLSNRLLRPRVSIEPAKLNRLKTLTAMEPGANLHLIDDADRMTEIGKLIARVDRILLTHKQGHHGFVHEIRWSDEEAARTRDGLDIATIDLSAGEAAGFRMAKNWSVVKTLNRWGGGSVFEKLSNKCIAGASAVGLITVPGPESAQYFAAGRAMERAWIKANQSGIAFQPMTGLTFMLHRLIHGKGHELTPQNIQELEAIKQEFYQLFQLTDKVHPAFLFRLLIAEEPEKKSLRRPIEDVLTINRAVG